MPDDSYALRKYYEDAFRTYDKKRSVPDIDVSFYPYVGINHTIRVRDGRVFVRIGEICREMPHIGQQALAYILVAKLYRKRVPVKARDIYDGYVELPEIREKANESKRKRGRKVITSADGEIYDLNEIFGEVNAKYFAGSVAKPTLTWSAKKTYRILGHHDSTHSTIVVSKSLDSADVPRYVVEYIVFHEMLHIFHPTKYINGRRYNHTPAFRRDERKFKYFKEAEKWIETNVSKLKRRARRQNS